MMCRESESNTDVCMSVPCDKGLLYKEKRTNGLCRNFEKNILTLVKHNFETVNSVWMELVVLKLP